MRILLLEAVDPEERKLRLRKVLNYARRHKGAYNMALGAGNRRAATLHLDKHAHASRLIRRYDPAREPNSADPEVRRYWRHLMARRRVQRDRPIDREKRESVIDHYFYYQRKPKKLRVIPR